MTHMADSWKHEYKEIYREYCKMMELFHGHPDCLAQLTNIMREKLEQEWKMPVWLF